MTLDVVFEGCTEKRVLDGVSVPWSYGDLAREVAAIREGVAIACTPHAWLIRVTGTHAHDVMDRVCARDLYVREGQIRPSLVLREDGTPLADVYVGLDEEGYVLTGEGAPSSEIVALLRDAVHSGEDATVVDMAQSHVQVVLTGPFAWDLLAAIEGPDILGFPYLTHYSPRAGWYVFRAGKTGEYGYDVWLPRDALGSFWSSVRERGAAFDLQVVGLDALWHCGLENNFFNAYEQRSPGLTPLELQLQWRISFRKDYLGATALRARRAAGCTERVTSVASRVDLSAGDSVCLDDAVIGQVIVARRSLSTGLSVGLARIARAYAHSSIDRFVARGIDDKHPRPLFTFSPPCVNNRSLYVRPQEHAYATRAEISFPSLSRLG